MTKKYVIASERVSASVAIHNQKLQKALFCTFNCGLPRGFCQNPLAMTKIPLPLRRGLGGG